MGRFLSTPSARRATKDGKSRRYSHQDFYPRPPRGGRQWLRPRAAFAQKFLSTPSARRATTVHSPSWGRVAEFLSTPSARRATREAMAESLEYVISIHALREEGDNHRPRLCVRHRYFYPRPPRGGRPSWKSPIRRFFEFLSTPSARRATTSLFAAAAAQRFLSTPSARRAT